MTTGEERDDELERQDWERIGKRLTLYAYRRLRGIGVDDMARAQDLAQEAIGRLFDPDYAGWDRGRQPSLLEHLGSVVNGLVSNLRRKRARRTVPVSLEEGRLSPLVAAQPGAEARVADAEELARVWAMLQESLRDDELGGRVLELIVEGCERPREQARALSIDVERIYQARRRLRRRIAEVRAALRREDQPGQATPSGPRQP